MVSDIAKSRLKALAVAKHGIHITPVMDRKSLDDCFVDDFGRITLWYNTPDHSTHIVWVPSEEVLNVN